MAVPAGFCANGLRFFVVVLLVAWLAAMAYHRFKPLPEGLSREGPFRLVSEVEFLSDLSVEQNGSLVLDQRILARMERIVEEADRFILIDMFLLNGLYDQAQTFPPLASDFVSRLIAKKKRSPEVEIVCISDPINLQYGTVEPELFGRLRAGGVRLILTDLDPLRDSNPLYSAGWRLLGQWFDGGGRGILPSPFAANGPPMSLGAFLRLLNFKANHRKILANEREAMLTSLNLHDASAYHANIALVVRGGGLVEDLVRAERAVAALSGSIFPELPVQTDRKGGSIRARLLTEGRIKARLLEALARAGTGSRIDLALFYLADRDIVGALLAASRRGALVRILLDPGHEAFGRRKNGIPNRPVARELVEKSEGRIRVRWYKSRGEQFHPKLALVSLPGEMVLIGGSANFTRRNLDDLNLESALELRAPAEARVMQDASHFFERVWSNQGGLHSVDFEVFRDRSVLRYGLYRFQEWSGMGTF